MYDNQTALELRMFLNEDTIPNNFIMEKGAQLHQFQLYSQLLLSIIYSSYYRKIQVTHTLEKLHETQFWFESTERNNSCILFNEIFKAMYLGSIDCMLLDCICLLSSVKMQNLKFYINVVIYNCNMKTERETINEMLLYKLCIWLSFFKNVLNSTYLSIVFPQERGNCALYSQKID